MCFSRNGAVRQTTNRYTAIGTVTPTYDNNGNLKWDGFYNYTWDGEGNLATLNSNAETYDALDRRVEQYNGSAYTEIVYGPAGNKFALMNGQTVTKLFAPLSAGATAVYNSSGLEYYRHPDWLGSSRIASTPGRTLYYDGAYAPFGENYAETGTTDRNFTGQNQDLTPGSTGLLYDFPYREQHSTQGRWISPDPAGIDAVNPTNPQSWNRYSYVNGDPTNSTDPAGLCNAAVAGINMTPNSMPAFTNFASSIGADTAYPFGSSGIVLGAGRVLLQGAGSTTSTSATVAAINAAAAQGPVNVFTYSGGAGSFAAALPLLSPAAQSQIMNVVYIAPGNVGALPLSPGQNLGGQTVVVTGTGAANWAAGIATSTPNQAVTVPTSCAHTDIACLIQQSSSVVNHLIPSIPTSGCTHATNFAPSGGGGSGTGNGNTAPSGVPFWYYWLWYGFVSGETPIPIL